MRQAAPDNPDPRILLLDSITEIKPEDAGRVLVAASHAGISAVQYAFGFGALCCFFNNAGVGKENAGIAGLVSLNAQGIAAAAYGHDTARIGDALDAWANGILTHVNELAAQSGLKPGMSVQAAAARMLR